MEYEYEPEPFMYFADVYLYYLPIAIWISNRMVQYGIIYKYAFISFLDENMDVAQ
jgi:hypothetical protein